MRYFKPLLVYLSLAALAGCGGGGSPPVVVVAPVEPPWERGTLLQSPPLRVVSFTPATLKQRLSADTVRDKALLALTGDPLCGVDVQSIQYTTVGGVQERTTGSGALMVPTGLDAKCTGARPIVLYAHGTNPVKTYNLASLAVETNAAYTEGLLLAAFFAAQGYIVVAPNYAGYDSSTLPYHPFLVADQQSKDMIDALTAAKKALPSLGGTVSANGKLFISGYSQGGYVAMATHRALQNAGVNVTASAPASGPYALAAQTDQVFYGQVFLGSTLFGPLLTSGYQKVYKNIYAAPGDFFESAYTAKIESLLPGADVATLISTGSLPEYALFSLNASVSGVSAAVQSVMQATTPPKNTSMDKVFATGFGSGNLFTNAARAAVLQDALNNPDGSIPTVNSGMPAASPLNPLRAAVKLNDLRGWFPTSPVLLCGGSEDATVPYSTNTRAMANLWAGLPAGRLTVLDVDSRTTGNSDPFQNEKLGFAVVKNGIYATALFGGKNPDFEVASSYHAGVLPFCNSAARTFFNTY